SRRLKQSRYAALLYLALSTAYSTGMVSFTHHGIGLSCNSLSSIQCKLVLCFFAIYMLYGKFLMLQLHPIPHQACLFLYALFHVHCFDSSNATPWLAKGKLYSVSLVICCPAEKKNRITQAHPGWQEGAVWPLHVYYNR
ncbi:hypothetical protein MP228_005869, partial [Amoeboaphelidium protococcarum]